MIVFVDYNDVCRAPMAAAVCRALYDKTAESAGVYADEGAAVCEAVRPALLEGHTARKLTIDILERAEKIYCVTAAIALHLQEEQPLYRHKIIAMQDIPDPTGMGKMAYERCAEEIRKQLEALSWEK